MKILLLAVVALLAWWGIGRLGLWLHKKNAGKNNTIDDLEHSLKNLEYALGPIGRIQSALNACRGDGTKSGLHGALREYIRLTMVEGKDRGMSSIMLMCDYSGDDVLVATAIGDEFHRAALDLTMRKELRLRRIAAPTDYAKFAWELVLNLVECSV